MRGGSKVALVGSSGAGKSTLVNLLLRIVNNTRGEIRIDGQNIAEVKSKSLYDNVAFVSQNIILFNRTILENIAYPNRIKTEEQKQKVIKAPKLATIHDFIEELPGL